MGGAGALGMTTSPCELCEVDGGVVLFRDDALRIVRVEDRLYPAFLRVVLNAHVREMSDLEPEIQQRVFQAVLACERLLRHHVAAHKINLASLGNQTPHVHWHVIARFPHDAHFPDAIWGEKRRDAAASRSLPDDELLTQELKRELSQSASP